MKTEQVTGNSQPITTVPVKRRKS